MNIPDKTLLYVAVFLCTIRIGTSQICDSFVVNVQSVTDVACVFEASGSVTVEIFDGAAPYVYSIFDSTDTEITNSGTVSDENFTFTNLLADTYRTEVMDVNNCIIEVNTTVSEPEGLVSTVTVFSDISCFGNNDGELGVTATGGTPPYMYSLRRGGVEVIPASTDAIFSGLSPADYEVIVTDTFGCQVFASVVLQEPDVLTLQIIEIRDLFCFDDQSGSITAEAMRGVPPYEYSIDNFVNHQVSPSFANLPAGNYTISCRDSNACIVSLQVTIINPVPVLAEVEIDYFSVSDNTIEVIGNGGTPPFSYSLQQEATVIETNTSGVFNVPAANYTLQLTDANGCIFEEEIIISYEDTNSDGIADNDEDVNGNGVLDDDDTDGDDIPDYLDDDDDNDGVDSAGEIANLKKFSTHFNANFLDTDEDLIPNHRDTDDDNDGIPTIEEDYNGNGDPTDDDTDNSGIPDYLEQGVALSVAENIVSNRFSFYPNPVTSELSIEFNDLGGATIEVSIFDVWGNKVFSKDGVATDQMLSINVSSLSAAMYFVVIDNGDIKGIKKMFKR
ncbi:T9SS type A sorting domain-containing protein [Aquimarina sp. RZ0]|uniref:T9SS type A sorting domain-containing protein n=1 Tax=Aquimarina sp. RZ0 TaxID=2607730 RepID=UPI0011F0F405|nr:T9SS type A sorting domain-containing protein [Aquimarina sp. RZ0]KAA1247810.1 T9SS type A sorting domain-containing protein [Aquimarina sp. RZ0]